MISFLFTLFFVIPLSVVTTVVPFIIEAAFARFNRFKAIADKVRPSAAPLSDPDSLSVSVIIPAFREAETVLAAIRHAKANIHIEAGVEFIVSVVDDLTAARLQDSALEVTVVRSMPGRSAALNAGAAVAGGDVLLFLHADCKLPRYWDLEVRLAVCREGVVGGAFAFDLDLPSHAKSPALRALVASTNFRSSILQLPYGDQAIFVSRKRFHGMGGFPEMPLMEDYEFVRRLRRAALHRSLTEGVWCGVATLPVSVRCSPRRWLHKGVVSTTVTNQVIVGLYVFFGIDANTLYEFYYGARLSKA
eukprot:CAMPEP_0196758594 /NCGR_PEP_ID=MMETSP1091-20130531/104270_1 /TAXON_ID=302021 /ORGANISM="Rhodomonas sp., Strain CCMP768" /LENGTH=303 /DNA_ID=CAMNT_0042107423 /DNA_START=64 /DNA_END=975 /DNA_ORIENTATION=-